MTKLKADVVLRCFRIVAAVTLLACGRCAPSIHDTHVPRRTTPLSRDNARLSFEVARPPFLIFYFGFEEIAEKFRQGVTGVDGPRGVAPHWTTRPDSRAVNLRYVQSERQSDRASSRRHAIGRIVMVINLVSHKFCGSSFAIGKAEVLCSPLLWARAGSRGT